MKGDTTTMAEDAAKERSTLGCTSHDLLFDVLGDEQRHHPVLGPDALARVTAGKVGHQAIFAAAAWRINRRGSSFHDRHPPSEADRRRSRSSR
jgi:hypothetical protein